MIMYFIVHVAFVRIKLMMMMMMMIAITQPVTGIARECSRCKCTPRVRNNFLLNL